MVPPGERREPFSPSVCPPLAARSSSAWLSTAPGKALPWHTGAKEALAGLRGSAEERKCQSSFCPASRPSSGMPEALVSIPGSTRTQRRRCWEERAPALRGWARSTEQSTESPKRRAQDFHLLEHSGHSHLTQLHRHHGALRKDNHSQQDHTLHVPKPQGLGALAARLHRHRKLPSGSAPISRENSEGCQSRNHGLVGHLPTHQTQLHHPPGSSTPRGKSRLLPREPQVQESTQTIRFSDLDTSNTPSRAALNPLPRACPALAQHPGIPAEDAAYQAAQQHLRLLHAASFTASALSLSRQLQIQAQKRGRLLRARHQHSKPEFRKQKTVPGATAGIALRLRGQDRDPRRSLPPPQPEASGGEASADLSATRSALQLWQGSGRLSAVPAAAVQPYPGPAGWEEPGSAAVTE